MGFRIRNPFSKDNRKSSLANLGTLAVGGPAGLAAVAGLGSLRGQSIGESLSNPLNAITGGQDAKAAANAATANRQNQLENAFNSVPGRRSIVDENGNLLRQFSSRSSAAGNQLRDFASGGADPIRDRLLDIQQASNSQALQNVAAQNQGNLQSGFSALASRGGLSGGARERLTANAFNQGLLAQQRQGFDNAQAVRGIDADSASRRFSALNSVIGLDNADRALGIQDLQLGNQDNINRASALLESRLASRDTPQGGFGGFLQGTVGNLFGRNR